MTNEKEIACIVCPIGCKILVKIDGKQFKTLKGNKCKSGIEYAKDEVLNPKRMMTTSVLVEAGEWPLVSVKTSQPAPKEKLFSILEEIKKTTVKAPVKSGQIVIKNVAHTDIDIIATKTIKKFTGGK